MIAAVGAGRSASRGGCCNGQIVFYVVRTARPELAKYCHGSQPHCFGSYLFRDTGKLLRFAEAQEGGMRF